MERNTSSKGKKAEDIAVRYLKSKGYKILDRNYRRRFGEIDVIAVRKKILVFIEVKYRKDTKWGYPFEAVDSDKIRKMELTANAYISNHTLRVKGYRFDVISIIGDESITHMRDVYR
ncbi:MAG: YraN family protein [Thermotoga sp.]|nr:MAG: YraN family protein [Thermotoga sp.]